LAQITGWLMAAELRALGVDVSFAPVLDLDRGVCAIIGDRAIHSNPEVVADLAQAYQGGMHQAGMAGTGKHFPGHGGVQEDSHYDLPVDQRRLEDLEMEDLLPYERMIHAGLAAIMSAHVVFPEIDPQPASFSSFWLQKILRERLDFQGVIFSDDLSMGAAASIGEHWERAKGALQAGCDMLPVCNAPDAVPQVLDHLSGYNDPAAHARLARLHGRPAPNWQELHGTRRWQQAVDVVSSYDEAPLLDMDL
ncbi:MAG: beta-N-acetylhexosaminidase, partial [Gammaproteobacteria bacterium]